MPELLNLRLRNPYVAALRCQDPFVLLEGSRGTLKTISILDILMARAQAYPGLRWYIWRSSRALLSTTILPSFEQYVIPRWAGVAGMRLMNPGARPTQRSEYVFENGSVFLPIGMDDELRGTSAEGAGGYLAEAIELEESRQAEVLAGMMRQPGIPFHQILVDVNPGAPGHWANHRTEPASDDLRAIEFRVDQLPQDRRFCEVYRAIQRHNNAPAAEPAKRWKRIITTLCDNPFFFDLANWALLPAGLEYLKNLQNLTGHTFLRWVRGLWAAATGTVFPEFSTARNVIRPFAIPEGWPTWCMIDPGYNHPCGVTWETLAPNGKKYTFDEIKGSGIDLDDLVERIRRKAILLTHGYFLDPRGASQHTQVANGKSFQELLAARGIVGNFWPAVAGRQLEASVEAHRQAVKRGEYVVFETCPETIGEHQNWKYKSVKGGVLPVGDDAFEDKNNDCLDGIMGWERLNPTFPLPPPPPRVSIVPQLGTIAPQIQL